MKKRTILIVVLSLLLIGSLYIPAKAIITNQISCRNEHQNLITQNQVVIDEINKIEILTNQSPTKAYVKTHGGCGSINPLGIVIEKKYTGPFTGAEVVDSIRKQLGTSGYKFTREDFGSEGCKAIYRSEATKNNTKIYVAAAQKENKIIGCTDGYPTGISEEVFRKQTIDTALINPKM